MKTTAPIINRELSWLDFNNRVLQEAEDGNVPLIERLRFLGIFSNNLDEFFRVRVASTKRLTELPFNEQEKLLFNPSNILEQINEKTVKSRKRFDKAYKVIKQELKKENIFIVDDKELLNEHKKFVFDYFLETVKPALVPIMLDKVPFPKLNGNSIYFAIKLVINQRKTSFALMEIPSLIQPRFIVLPSIGNKKYIILLDDIIRFQLNNVFAIFNYKSIEAYTIKTTLDAEIDIDDDISKSIIDKLTKGIKQRKTALSVRFLYDKNMPEDLLDYILKQVKPSKNDSIIAGGKYHNFKDFIKFPNVGSSKLNYKPHPPLEHPRLKNKSNILDEIKKGDLLLNFPYHKFRHIIDILRESAIDPNVFSIKINLYRIAENSKIIHALISAAKNGKKVTVIIEPRARFDEQMNIYTANKLNDQGVKVIVGMPGLKVHSKLILITRKEKNKMVKYGHIGTGNFHENNAKIYVDYSLLTCDVRITNELNKVFRLFKNNYERPTFKHLLVSPFNTRRKIYLLIDNEIAQAKKGEPGYILLKLNNLIDDKIIKRLYKASKAGVKIDLIIRGISSLVPEIKGFSENIRAISIVDRYLEHSRVLIFGNNDNPIYYILSADMMNRNLSQRIEVGIPVYDIKIQAQIQQLINFQLNDNTKARILKGSSNTYCRPQTKEKNRAQQDTYNFFKEIT